MNQARIAASLLVVVLSACKASAPAESAAAAPAATPAAAPAQAAAVSQSAAPAEASKPQPAVATGKIELTEGACNKTEDDFWSFFQDYVNREDVRARYTAPTIEIRSYADPKKVLGSEAVQGNGAFKIGLVDNMWSYIEPSRADDDTPYDRVELDLRNQGDFMRMNFSKAEYAPNDDLIKKFGAPGAYVFQHKDNCWQLVQELR